MPKTLPPRRRRRPIKRIPCGAYTITVQSIDKPPYQFAVVKRQKGQTKRETEYFVEKGEALTKAQAWAVEAGNVGAQAASAMTNNLKRDVMNWRHELDAYGKGIGDAVAFYLDHLRATCTSKPVSEVAAALLALKEKKGKRERYQRDMSMKLGRFCQMFGTRMIAELNASEVEQWLDSLNVGAISWNNERRYLNLLWNFAISKSWAAVNVIAKIDCRDVEETSPEILTIPQTRALLNAADDSIRGYYAIALFGGVRDAEIKRLDWRSVNLLTGYITIESDVSKTRRKRLVPITPNLKAWLLPVAKSHGPVAPETVDEIKKQTFKRAGIIEWPQDGTRHSFGTYEMARTKDIGHVSEVMGNSPSVVKRHYQKAVPFEQGDEFFAIFPEAEGESNIVPMGQPARHSQPSHSMVA
jgi:integrase